MRKRVVINNKLYAKIATHLDGIFAGYEMADIPSKRKLHKLWFTASVIISDCIRENHHLNRSTATGVSQALAVASIAKVLYEAYVWVNNIGNPGLLKLVDSPEDHKTVKEMMKDGGKLHALSKYSDYRNKISAHYDLEIIEEIKRIQKVDVVEISKDLDLLMRYMGNWLKIAKFIGMRL